MAEQGERWLEDERISEARKNRIYELQAELESERARLEQIDTERANWKRWCEESERQNADLIAAVEPFARAGETWREMRATLSGLRAVKSGRSDG